MIWLRFIFSIIAATGAAAIATLVHTETQWVYPVLVGSGVGYIAYQFAEGTRAVRRHGNQGPITEEEGKAAYTELRGIITRLDQTKTPSVETATFLLDTEKESFERTYSGSDNLESKATTLLGIVAGATSAFGVFGIAKAGSTLITTPIILTAFGFVIISIVALLYMLRAKTFDIPDMRPYLTAATVGEDNRVALSLVVAQRYREMREQLRRKIEAEPNALFIAYASIAIAAALVVLNTFTLAAARCRTGKRPPFRSSSSPRITGATTRHRTRFIWAREADEVHRKHGNDGAASEGLPGDRYADLAPQAEPLCSGSSCSGRASNS